MVVWTLCRCFLLSAYALRINRNIHCRHVHLFCIYGTSGRVGAAEGGGVYATIIVAAESGRIEGNSRGNSPGDIFIWLHICGAYGSRRHIKLVN